MLKSSNSNCLYGSVKRNAKSNDYYANLNTAVALGKMHVPIKHKQIASNYVLIKRIFGSCVAAIPITNADRQAFDQGSPFLHDRVKGERPMHVHH